MLTLLSWNGMNESFWLMALSKREEKSTTPPEPRTILALLSSKNIQAEKREKLKTHLAKKGAKLFIRSLLYILQTYKIRINIASDLIVVDTWSIFYGFKRRVVTLHYYWITAGK